MATNRNNPSKKRFNKLFFAFLSTAILVFLYYLSSVEKYYLLFHSLVELFSIIIACMVFVIAWISYKYSQNNYLLIIGIAYLFIGMLDLLHTLSYKGMNIFLEYDFYANQIWIATRYLESITLGVSLFAINIKKKINPYIIFTIFSGIFLIITLSVFVFKIFPICFVENEGQTLFKQVSEYIISAILILDIVLLKSFKRHFTNKIFNWLLFSLIFTILSELAFTYYTSNYGFLNVVGHYFKIFSFYLIFKALILSGIERPYDFLFRNLKESEERYHILFDISPFGIIVHNDGIINLVNKRGTLLFGYINENELVGRNLFDFLLINDEKPYITKNDVNELIVNSSLQTKLKQPNNKLVDVAVYSEYFDYKNEILVLSLIVDITERKKLENLRRDVEHIMRHNLKTPLTSVLGYAELLLQEPLEQEIKQDIKNISESGKKMLDIINSSLDLLKMEEGTYKLKYELVDINEIINRLQGEFKTLLKDKSLKFQVSIEKLHSDSNQVIIIGDETQLYSLFENLLKNAIEASPKNETISFSIKENTDNYIFYIKNMGIIPAEIRKNFFDKYVTKGKNRGTGIGTYNAYIITKYHKGNITFTTSEKEGTTLIVSLPKEMQPEE